MAISPTFFDTLKYYTTVFWHHCCCCEISCPSNYSSFQVIRLLTLSTFEIFSFSWFSVFSEQQFQMCISVYLICLRLLGFLDGSVSVLQYSRIISATISSNSVFNPIFSIISSMLLCFIFYMSLTQLTVLWTIYLDLFSSSLILTSSVSNLFNSLIAFKKESIFSFYKLHFERIAI